MYYLLPALSAHQMIEDAEMKCDTLMAKMDLSGKCSNEYEYE